MTDLEQKLTAFEQLAGQDPSLIPEVEQTYESLLAQAPDNIPLLLRRNEFRVKNQTHLKIRRPRVLLGTLNDNIYPNFHTVPMLKVVDLVSLTTSNTMANRTDRVQFDHIRETMAEVVQRLPAGYKPDFYWDPYICGASIVPRGLEKAPFPTVAGICHHFKAAEIANYVPLFDIVLPFSLAFSRILRETYPNQLFIDHPFGMIYGSLHHIVPNFQEKKDIDVLVSFGRQSDAVYGDYRARVNDLFDAFNEKYGDRYNLVKVSGLEKNEYLRTIARSKIALNVVGWHGPYNYRTIELINAGTMLMQLRPDYPIKDQPITDYFEEAKHLATFTVDDFEAQLLHYLENPALVAEISRKGRDFVETEYAYEKLFLDLCDKVAAIPEERLQATYKQRPTSRVATHHLAQAFYHSNLSGKQSRAILHLLGPSKKPPFETARDLLVLLPFLLQELSFNNLKGLLPAQIGTAWEKDPASGIKLLYQMIKRPTAIDHWNYVMANLEVGNLLADEIAKMLDTLAQTTPTDWPVDETTIANLYPNFPSIAEEMKEAKVMLMDLPFLQAKGDQGKVGKAFHRYMTWLLTRLYAEISDEQDMHIETCIKLLPSNASFAHKLREFGHPLADLAEEKAREIYPSAFEEAAV